MYFALFAYITYGAAVLPLLCYRRAAADCEKHFPGAELRSPCNKSSIVQACSGKIANPFFSVCSWIWALSRSINTQKKELGQYPSILTSRLVNNQQI